MNLNLTGKNVLVTGSAGLIGSELCRQLADEGANLLLLDTSPKNEELRRTLAEKHAGGTFVHSTLNVAHEDTAKAIAAIVEGTFGGTLHGLVNAVQYKSQSF